MGGGVVTEEFGEGGGTEEEGAHFELSVGFERKRE
jgi:hypothetical protein